MADDATSLTNSGRSCGPKMLAGERPQFGLQWLLIAVTWVCLTTAAAREIGWPAVFLPLTAWAITFACRHSSDAMRLHRAVSGAVLGLSIFVHAIACKSAYGSLGEVRSGLMHLSLILYVPLIIDYLGGVPARAAVLGMMVAMLFAAPLFVWTNRLSTVRAEVKRIVTFAELKKGELGHYPTDLIGYSWSDLSSQPYIHYDCTDQGHLMVYFWSGNRHAPHWYSCTSGWGYYPD